MKPGSGRRTRSRDAGRGAVQLALEPRLPLVRRHRRTLLPRLEQARRSTLDDHVHRLTRLGSWVLTNGIWYKASIIYKQTGNLRAVQILLGHTKIESTVRYLGVDIEDALALAENTEV